MKSMLSVVFVSFILSGCSVYDYFFSKTPENSLADKNFNWQKYNTENFDIYYEPGSYAEKKIEYLSQNIESDLEAVLNMGGETVYPNRIFYFLFETKEIMKQHLGKNSNALAYPRHNSLYAVYGADVKATGRHEIAHLVSFNLWGSPGEKWISEGFAVYTDGDWHGVELTCLNKYLKEKGKLLPPGVMEADFSEYSPMITYPQAGGFTDYLVKNYGIEKFKLLWKIGKFENIYGISLPEMEKEWQMSLDNNCCRDIEYVY